MFHRFLKGVFEKCLPFLLLLLCLASVSAQLAEGYDKFIGNIHYQGAIPLNFDQYWNQITPENSGKWASCEQVQDDFSYWSWLDTAYDYAQANGFLFKQHTLVWGHSSGEPAWMSSLSTAEQLEEVIEWFTALSERYPDFDMIDVVNEPLHAPPSYTAALGGDGNTGWDWVIWSYEQARQYFPNSQLLINDYNILYSTSETAAYLEIINLLQSRDLLDGIGVQGHSLESVETSMILTNLNSLAATGLPIYLSEYEVQGDDETQLSIYQQQFPLFWEHPSVAGITLWGYVDGEMWRNDGYLLTADGEERPALTWLYAYLQEGATVPPTPTPTPPPTAYCAGIQVWDENTSYDTAGTEVVYNGNLYVNNWYSSGQNPEEYEGEFNVWTFVGECIDLETTPTPSPTATPDDTGILGDVNSDGSVTIVDALMTAQYYVGLNPAGFDGAQADVDCDGTISIVDALIIAQYYVGLLTDFPC